ncbi:hypothetical protein ACNTMW_31050 [Planosporangium sp. 12N6]|uniref:hypothetical protein n=1 Tax=Planosporangium spinosum TaxID=3402278 RepID=UPI003CFAFE71
MTKTLGSDPLVWRGVYRVPPDVRLDTVGPYCPLDDSVLLVEPSGWCCPRCGAVWDVRGRHGQWLTAATVLERLIVAEDAAETAGMLTADERQTCHTCRTWASAEHTASAAHWAAVDAAADRVTDAELAETVCMVAAPDGVRGMCWRPRPCPDHEVLAGEVVDEPAARLRRVDRLLAATIGAGVVAGAGYGTGHLVRPWGHAVPDEVVWALVGALAIAGAAGVAVALLWRWLDACRGVGAVDEPGVATAEGEVPDGR